MSKTISYLFFTRGNLRTKKILIKSSQFVFCFLKQLLFLLQQMVPQGSFTNMPTSMTSSQSTPFFCYSSLFIRIYYNQLRLHLSASLGSLLLYSNGYVSGHFQKLLFCLTKKFVTDDLVHTKEFGATYKNIKSNYCNTNTHY